MRKIILFIFLILFIFAESAFCSRYVSLAPSTTEILFALGLDEEIVGVSTYCNYPEKAKSKEKIGNFSQPNVEKILSLKPDYIFCTGLEQAKTVEDLKRLNLKVYVSDPKSIDELFATIEDIAKITGKVKQASVLISDMKSQIKKVNDKVKLIPENNRPKVFIEIWHSPITTAGKGCFVDELVTLAGGINIADDVKRPYSIFSQEEVIKRNPDFIILAYMDKDRGSDFIRKRFGWGNISAVKNNRIYNDINPDILLRPGPRIAQGIIELYKRFYDDAAI